MKTTLSERAKNVFFAKANAFYRVLVRLVKYFNFSIDRIDFGIYVSINGIPNKSIFFISGGDNGFTQDCEIEDLDYMTSKFDTFVTENLSSLSFEIGERRFVLELVNDNENIDRLFCDLHRHFPTISRTDFKPVYIKSYNILFRDLKTLTATEILVNAAKTYRDRSKFWRAHHVDVQAR